MGKRVFSVTPAPKHEVGYTDLSRNPESRWIELRRPVEFSKRALPFTAAAVNRSPVVMTKGATRLEFEGSVEFSQPSIVVTIAPVIIQTQCQMCIRQSRSNC